MSNTSTYTETRIVSLNSESGTQKNGSFLSDLAFSFPNLLRVEPDIVHTQISLANAQIPVSFYTANYTNNVFRINSTTITIPVGNYNSSSLSSQIIAQLLLAGITMTITISRTTGVFTWTSTAPFTLFGSSSITTAEQLLGLSSTSDTVAALVLGSYVATLPFPCNLLGIKQLLIKSNILSGNNYSASSGGQTTLLATCPVNVGAWGMITFESRSKISVNNGSLDEIDIQIMDAETNLPVNFNNQNWTMTLILHITRELSTKLLPLESIPLAKTDGNKADVPPPPKVVTQDQLDLKLLES
jgi:hypothetical protein